MSVSLSVISKRVPSNATDAAACKRLNQVHCMFQHTKLMIARHV